MSTNARTGHKCPGTTPTVSSDNQCSERGCDGAAEFALFLGPRAGFARADDGTLAPLVCEQCRPRCERRHEGVCIRPQSRLISGGRL